jgi:hypothetical protein
MMDAAPHTHAGLIPSQQPIEFIIAQRTPKRPLGDPDDFKPARDVGVGLVALDLGVLFERGRWLASMTATIQRGRPRTARTATGHGKTPGGMMGEKSAVLTTGLDTVLLSKPVEWCQNQ